MDERLARTLSEFYSMKTISLRRLTSSCIFAGWQGCQVIRSFHRMGGTKEGRLKIDEDPRSVVTQCDIDAQATIIQGLRQVWGTELQIIGEEETPDAVPELKEACRTDLLLGDDPQDWDDEIPLEEIVVFVDPVDGTREFVEGRLDNVACLIGIARNARTIAGIVGVPFPNGNMMSDAQIHYAICEEPNLSGIWPLNEITSVGLDDEWMLLTGDSKNAILKKAVDCARRIGPGNLRHSIVGGTASKLRRVAASTTPTLSILHFNTELWDTCAPEALLKSKGGKLTDLFGSPLVHCPKRKVGNIFGVVASKGANELHDSLCQAMREDKESVYEIFKDWAGENVLSSSEAMDVARDLDGMPYSVQQIQQLLENDNPRNTRLLGYSVPEETAWRGLMSNGVGFRLTWEDTGGSEATTTPPTDVFYKRIEMGNLAYAQDKLKTAPHKLARDVKSYQVEAAFLTSDACNRLVTETGMKINKVLASDLRPVSGNNPKDLLDSKFSMFLEYFQRSNGWKQHWLLNEDQVNASLAELAKLHAFFWDGSDFWKEDGGKVGQDLESKVWQNGGYMQPKLQGYDQLTKVRSGWEARYPSFRDDLNRIQELDGVDIESLGKRLEDVAPLIGKESHPFSESDAQEENDYGRYRTLIHGDPKHANFFFRPIQESTEEKIQVGLIDFQWAGFGLAATDVAHHIASAVSVSVLSLDGRKESQLLDHYYSCLSKELVRFGVGETQTQIENLIFPRKTLQEQYDVAFLDVCRIVFAYSWRRWNAETEPTDESFNRNAYNKSLGNVLWLITRCHVLLQNYESKILK